MLAVPYLLLATRAQVRDQWRSAEALRAMRERRLRRLVEAAMRAPHYAAAFRSAGISPGEVTLKDLARLPILEKSVLQDERAADLVTQPPASLFTVATSGSTGTPLRLYRSDRDQARISAQWARVFGAYGRRPRDRQVNIASGRIVAKRGPAALLRRIGVLPPLHQLASFDPPAEQIRVLRSVRPTMISAYAVGLELAAEAVLEADVRDIRPRIIYTTGTALTPRCRALARRAFGVDPYDVYATNEVGPIAWECPVSRGVLHLNDDCLAIEIVDEDGRPLPAGRTGEVVVTHLLCTAQPLIRYRIGDLGSLRAERCRCGRGLGLMDPVQGRTLHTIRAPDGRVINTITVSSILAGADEVRRYQVHETAPGVLRIMVVPAAEWTTGAEAAIRGRFSERLGSAFQYEVERVDELPLTPGGKFQTIVPLAGSGA